MTRPPSMPAYVWRSLLRLPAALVLRVLRGDDTRPREGPPPAPESDDDVMAPLRRWRSG